jgi:hypothetical protein
METSIPVKFTSLHRYASPEDNGNLWTASRYAQPAEGFLHYTVSGPGSKQRKGMSLEYD